MHLVRATREADQREVHSGVRGQVWPRLVGGPVRGISFPHLSILSSAGSSRFLEEREGATPFSSRSALNVNGSLMKPSHVIVETMM